MYNNEHHRESFCPTLTVCFPNRDDSFQAFVDLQSAFSRGDTALISRVFRLCREISSAKDFRHLLLFVRNAFTLLTMMDYPYPTSFMVPLPGHPVAFAADLIMKADTPMEGLYQATALVYNGTQGLLSA